MADLSADVEVNVTTPATIDVPLVRADHLKTSDVYRAVFDVALALFAAGLGAVFGGEDLGTFGWPFLIATGVAAGAFLYLSFRWRRRGTLNGENAESDQSSAT